MLFIFPTQRSISLAFSSSTTPCFLAISFIRYSAISRAEVSISARCSYNFPLHKMYTFVYRTFIKFILFCRGQALDVSMPFHLASLILQSQTKCLTILYFLSFYTFDTFCFGWHFCNTFVISPKEFICFLY